jgi:hypothetical protein
MPIGIFAHCRRLLRFSRCKSRGRNGHNVKIRPPDRRAPKTTSIRDRDILIYAVATINYSWPDLTASLSSYLAREESYNNLDLPSYVEAWKRSIAKRRINGESTAIRGSSVQGASDLVRRNLTILMNCSSSMASALS